MVVQEIPHPQSCIANKHQFGTFPWRRIPGSILTVSRGVYLPFLYILRFFSSSTLLRRRFRVFGRHQCQAAPGRFSANLQIRVSGNFLERGWISYMERCRCHSCFCSLLRVMLGHFEIKHCWLTHFCPRWCSQLSYTCIISLAIMRALAVWKRYLHCSLLPWPFTSVRFCHFPVSF